MNALNREPPAKLPLSGIVVLEISDTPGAAFAGALLADFDASVYVAETPARGSAMRDRKPAEWWDILARNKKSVQINAAATAAAGPVRALLAHAHIIVTDVPQAGRDVHPWLRHLGGLQKRPLLVDVIAPGSDRPELWPWSKTADLAGALTGMMALTGHAGQTPVQAEFPMVDYLAGALAAVRAMAELRRLRMQGGSAMDVVVPLHQAVQRMIEWQLPIATAMGTPISRKGNSFPMSYSISNMNRTKDGMYIAVSAANEATAARLLNMLGGPELRDNPRYSTTLARQTSMPEIYAIMDKWVAERTFSEVLETAHRHNVALGPIADARALASDEHILGRGSVVRVARPDGSSMPMPAVVPRFAGWSKPIQSIGPARGAHTQEALAECGFSSDAIGRLRVSGII